MGWCHGCMGALLQGPMVAVALRLIAARGGKHGPHASMEDQSPLPYYIYDSINISFSQREPYRNINKIMLWEAGA